MMTTKDPSVRWISNAYYWVFPFFPIFFSKFGVYTKGRAKVVGYVLERDKSPNLPPFSELSMGRVDVMCMRRNFLMAKIVSFCNSNTTKYYLQALFSFPKACVKFISRYKRSQNIAISKLLSRCSFQ